MSTLKKSKGYYLIDKIDIKLADEMLLDAGETLECEVKLIDARKITEQQRKFIFTLCREIAYHQGDDAEYVRLLMQQYYANLKDIEVESLSKCSVSYANGLISTIINFALENEVPLPKRILDDNDFKFDYQQTYIMCLKRICAVCGRRADLHHTTAIGMGSNRKTMSHVGLEIIPLCREHHFELHQMGNDKYLSIHKLKPITVDEKMDFFIKKGTLKLFKEDSDETV